MNTNPKIYNNLAEWVIHSNLMQWVKRETRPPLHVQIVPTNLCNIACIFCWRVLDREEDLKKKNDRISDKRYLEIVEEICGSPKLRPKSITITGGGEPFIKKNLVVKMIEEIKKYNIHCEIVTNGCLMDKNVSKRLVECGLNRIAVSINAARPDIDDFIRGKNGSHMEALNCLRELNYWKDRLGSDIPTLGFTKVVTKHNYDQVCDMVDLAFEYRADTLNIRWVSEPQSKGKPGPLTMPPYKYPEFMEEIKRAERLAKLKGIALVKDFTEDDLRRYLNLAVHEDGKNLFISQETCENCENLNKQKDLIAETEKTSTLEFLMKENAYEELCNANICTFPFYELFIDASGFASGCGTLASSGGDDHSVAEDITKVNVHDVWYGERLNHLRVLMLLNKFTKICESCNVINVVKMSRTWTKKYK